MPNKKFYDIHLHLVNISHAGLLAYLNRFLRNHTLSYELLINRPFLKVFITLILELIFPHRNMSPIKRKIMITLLFVYLIINVGSLLFMIICIMIGVIISLINLEHFNAILRTAGFAVLIIVLINLIIVVYSLLKLLIRKIKYVKGKKLPKKETGFKAVLKNIINLLSILENDIGSSLLQIEIDIISLDSTFSSFQLKNNNNKTIGDTFRNLPRRNQNNQLIMNELEEKWLEYKPKGFNIGNLTGKYEKIILTPLIIDFEYDQFDITGIHYKNPPSKLVVAQTKDVFLGIRNYLDNSPFKIFEIYPFMGLNPNHYDLYVNPSIKGHNSLELMFEKYFSCFKQDENDRYQKLQEKMQEYSDNLDKNAEEIFIREIKKTLNKERLKIIKEDKISFSDVKNIIEVIETGKKYIHKKTDQIRNEYYNYFFCGIKVYPPLGYDPAPWARNIEKTKTLCEHFKTLKTPLSIINTLQNIKNQFDLSDLEEKLIFVYANCVEKNIPITTHCSDGGFLSETTANTVKFTSPRRWESVLELFPKLKLNFAHLGGGSFKAGYLKKLRPIDIEAKSWREKVYELATKYENVYTDFSCMCFDHFDYQILKKELDDWLSNHKSEINLYDKILFGTDFSINLMFEAESYQEYVGNFTTQNVFSDLEMEKFCETNPKMFLFE